VILAGDIGGTNCRLALVAPDGKRVVHQAAIPSRDHVSVESAVRAFLKTIPGKAPRISAATFGIAGPVVGGRVQTTNLPWTVDERTLAKKLGIARVTLINDLVALALGALTVPRSKLHRLHGDGLPKKSGGTLAVIAAGTGLGEAALVWDGTRLIPCGTEGGHTDFAPRDALEGELLDYLAERFEGHVSYERIVSGPGIGSLYDFFHYAKGVAEADVHAATIAAAPDRNAAITELGASGLSAPAARAVELFASIYGAEAGNLALKTLATGGVFVAGGIAAHLKDTLAKGPFVPSFLAKGRMRGLLEKVPIAIVLDSKIGLAGAAHHAATLAR
jgi:glucokinase